MVYKLELGDIIGTWLRKHRAVTAAASADKFVVFFLMFFFTKMGCDSQKGEYLVMIATKEGGIGYEWEGSCNVCVFIQEH